MGAARVRGAIDGRNIRRLVFHLTKPTAALVRGSESCQKLLDTLVSHGFQIDIRSGSRSEYDTVEPPMTMSLQQLHTLFIAEKCVESQSTPEITSTVEIDSPLTISEATETLQDLIAKVLRVPNAPPSDTRLFGSHIIPKQQVFHETTRSFCSVNLKPIVPGHVLIVPKRCVARFESLGADEVSDLWCTAQTVGKVVQEYYNAESLTFTIQDGPAAGQTVNHVHIHVIPRRFRDFAENDDVYEEIERHERSMGADHEQRHARSEVEMTAEADALRAAVASFSKDDG